MRVVGTAGHVDHGKSTLVRALTGIDPDRLKEEKARGMTIDLGFAWVDLHLPRNERVESGADGEKREILPVGIVDVPGHIDFIKNMLAGIGGIDAALLVVAADEGVMPQTREHLAILDLLDAPRCIVALTKVDLVDEPEWLDLVELDIEELLEATRFGPAENPAPILRVSAATGEGLEALKRELAGALTQLAPRRNRNRPRLPVDRVFTLSGFGAVVTGTLLDGDLAVGDEVVIHPGLRSARIRGMQSHKQQVLRAHPGSRVALNLAGIGAQELHRGDVVAHRGALEPTMLLDVQFRLLPTAGKPLRHNQAVDFFCGASERRAKVRLLGAEKQEPGSEGWLQLRFSEPVSVAAGDRFILRRPSPSMTLGGGQILHAQPGRRWKRFDPAVVERFEHLALGAPDDLLLDVAERHPFVSGRELIDRATLDAALGESALAEMVESGALHTVTVGNDTLYFTVNWSTRLLATARRELRRYHEEWPLRRGMPQSELRSRLGEALDISLSTRVLSALFAQWQQGEHTRDAAQNEARDEHETDDKAIKTVDGVAALAAHEPTLTSGQEKLLKQVLRAFAEKPSAPPSESDTLVMLQGDAELLNYIIEVGILVRLGQGVLLQAEVFEDMTAHVVEMLRSRTSITLADVRDHFGTSRRYAQALLEELDARRITRRAGDARTLFNASNLG